MELRRRAELLFGERAEEDGTRTEGWEPGVDRQPGRPRGPGGRRKAFAGPEPSERGESIAPGESGHGPPGARPRVPASTVTGRAFGTAPGLSPARPTATVARPRPTAAPPKPDAPQGKDTSRADHADRAYHADHADRLDHVNHPDGSDGADRPDGSAAPGRRERAGIALRERMPLWLQARCGLEQRGVIALAVLLAAAAVFAVQHFWTGRTQPVRAPEVVRAQAPFAVEGKGGEGERSEESEAGGRAGTGGGSGPGALVGAVQGSVGAEIVVDVSGKVRKPGIHRLPAGSRVVDALGAAGGVRPGTETDGLNRARFLVDGEQIVVGAPGAAAGNGFGGAAGSGSAGTAAGAGGPAAPVSLNTATVDQLDTLPGVGPVLARHIVDYRTQHGGFRSVDELREVNGIGDRRFSDLRNLVRP
ncbi:helix-hairpin-helix domain-containing protein [Streptomyces sp. NPDC006012]|uniref:helix-hairpin-helix domain-containing protein n=1 Tax=Streptomyces sp. NPDC006012 TaxID=3364739 RepID=UPI00367DF496